MPRLNIINNILVIGFTVVFLIFLNADLTHIYKLHDYFI